jgi:hypothetical protein
MSRNPSHTSADEPRRNRHLRVLPRQDFRAARRVDAAHRLKDAAVGGLGERLSGGHPDWLTTKDLHKVRRHVLDDMARATEQADSRQGDTSTHPT